MPLDTLSLSHLFVPLPSSSVTYFMDGPIGLKHCATIWPILWTQDTAPLAISPQLFYSKLKTLLELSSTNPILNHLLPTFLHVSTPNTIHDSRLTVCLTLWIWPDACRCCFGQALVNKLDLPTSFCGRCRNIEFRPTITINTCKSIFAHIYTYMHTYIQTHRKFFWKCYWNWNFYLLR